MLGVTFRQVIVFTLVILLWANLAWAGKTPGRAAGDTECFEKSLLDYKNAPYDTAKVARVPYKAPFPRSKVIIEGHEYELVEEITDGGFSTIWSAKDLSIEGDVLRVIKFESRQQVQLQEDVYTFEREHKLLVEVVQDPIIAAHTARPYGYGPTTHGKAIVMDYVPGRVLFPYNSYSVKELITLFKNLAPVVSRLHSIGIIHRDIKPENIIVGKDLHPYLLDYGMAKRKKEDHTVLGDSIVGTLNFFSPEALEGNFDELSDVWALTVSFFSAITGRLPFWTENKSISQLLTQIKTTPPDYHGVPKELVPFFERGFNLDKKKRFQSADEFKQALEAVER